MKEKIVKQTLEKWGIDYQEGVYHLEQLHGKKVLVKVGGDCLKDQSLAHNIADLCNVGLDLALVHGGGPQIDETMKESGIEIVKIGGYRAVPDKATLNVVENAVLSVNSAILWQLNSYGANPTLLQHALSATKMTPIMHDGQPFDLGYVGVVEGVKGELLKSSPLPVFHCVVEDGNGQKYNVNADLVAQSLVPHFDKYVSVTSVGGYMEGGKIVPCMNMEQAKSHMAQGGMAVKLDSMVSALEMSLQLSCAQMTSPSYLPHELLTEKGYGTMIVKE
ncbi:hypothetical protein BVX95_02215 [archaeon D22]|nr:hypothetical protein BVX95_02215 [archaeon D22]